MNRITIRCLLYLIISTSTHAQWDEGTALPSADGKWSSQFRENIFELSSAQWPAAIQRGKEHALVYPVPSTQLLIPYTSFKKFMDDKHSPLRQWIYDQTKEQMPFQSMEEFYNWLGIHPYPKSRGDDLSQLPRLTQNMADGRMGASLIERGGVTGITFSCAACHSAELFGKTVLGASNRFPRSFELFRMGTKYVRYINETTYRAFLNTTAQEAAMYGQSREAARWIATRAPQALGLDTSLSLVALSLHRRLDDEYASRVSTHGPWNPLPRHPLERFPIDSKPMPWWNVKYKTRWLSDGSVISGNPVFTNILWNEIGRGADLRELESTLKQNQSALKELTAAVFATKPPSMWEFFDPCKHNLEGVKRGEKLYVQSCQKCHGQYEKKWNEEASMSLSCRERLDTTRIHYHAKTPVIDVGTNPNRYQGMQYFAERLNQLKISKSFQTVVRPQKGYVPPPLVSIWSRYPYFHNNCAPTLKDVLTPTAQRAKQYWMVPPRDPQNDFDYIANGYPRAASLDANITSRPEYFYDGNRAGLSCPGHDQKILLNEQGDEKFTAQDKEDIIAFLQTL